SCAQYVVANIEFDPEAIYLHFGPSVAPGGYAWIFPKGIGVANVGLGVVTLRGDGRTVRQVLDDYIARHFPGGTVTGLTVGGVISGATVRRTVADGVLLAGDSAHMINPLSGGGIINAMKAGRLAGRHAARALAAGDTTARGLQPYHDEWMRVLGDAHLKYYKLKETINKFDDDFFNRLAATVNRIPLEKRTLARVMTSALVRHPALLPVAAQLFVQEFC
ncbi:MAG TPA: NAD(P)/FAD-dependent oxidoreductase, partial [Vicinamibacteria bacterium]|nr:NAD(P)/FAD-dependent oxidoreductase [Vicinamibacteria bacterium]